MPQRVFYPYAAGAGELELTAHCEEPGLPLEADRVLRLYEQDLNEYRICFEAAAPAELLQRVLPPDEHDAPPVEIVLTGVGVASRTRVSWPLHGLSEASSSVTFPRAQYAGILDVEACLVRTQARHDAGPRFAGARHSKLATSHPLHLEFDQPTTPPGASIDVLWTDFRQASDDWLRRNSGDIFALETSGELPRILLNQGVERAFSVLSSTGTSGRKARVRNVIYHTIVHQTWTSLLAQAVAELQRAAPDALSLGESEAGQESLEELLDWQALILRDWAPHLYPEFSAEDAIDQLVRNVQESNEVEILSRRLPNAIQTRFQTQQGFIGLVDELDL